MKKISTLALCLMLLLTLTACARHRPLRRPDGRPAGGRERESRPHSRPRGKRSAAADPRRNDGGNAALPAVSPEEQGNAPSNLSAGGAMVRGEDGALYLAQEDGIYALSADGSLTKISPDRAREP